MKHLEPLARSSCILQAAHARLDQVPLVFGTLLMEYSKLKADPELADTKEHIETIKSSIERWWKACDQSVYIAAILLHPLIKARAFSAYSSLNRMEMWGLIESLWKRFYPTQPAPTLWLQFENYLDGKNRFSQMENYAKHVKTMADSQVSESLIYTVDKELIKFQCLRISMPILLQCGGQWMVLTMLLF